MPPDASGPGPLASVWPGRLLRAVAAALVLLALICCALPLVHNLSYESAALFGVVTGAAAAAAAAWHHNQGGLLPVPLSGDASPAASWWAGLWRVALWLVVPALVLAANGLRVGACDPLLGALFWLVIPLPSVVLGHGLGWLSALVCSGHRGRALGLVGGLLLATVAWFLAHLALEPPITGHHVLLGYFSGSIYDEALALPPSLLAYRAVQLVALAGAVALVEGLWRRRQGPSWPLPWRAPVAAGLVALTLAAAGWAGRQAWFGVDLDRETIAAQLGGRLETEHFVIYYQPQPPESLDLQRLAQDHEFRYAEMKAFFGTDPVAWRRGQKIRSFVYADREQKGALMGGRRTLVAKLWLGEMHIIWRGLGDHLLAHELAHLFTASFGSGPLHLSGGLLSVNMGLVEGAAAAADWPADEMTMHEASAALRRMGLAPDIRGLVGASGFWRQAAGRAYTLMGSFVRWLIETRGIERFKRYYATGSIGEAYGGEASAAELVAGWGGVFGPGGRDRRADAGAGALPLRSSEHLPEDLPPGRCRAAPPRRPVHAGRTPRRGARAVGGTAGAGPRERRATAGFCSGAAGGGPGGGRRGAGAGGGAAGGAPTAGDAGAAAGAAG